VLVGEQARYHARAWEGKRMSGRKRYRNAVRPAKAEIATDHDADSSLPERV